jgi:hypothetical protein
MAAGADKKIEFSPAGALGLVDRSAKFLIRFDELETATRPQDETGVCEEFDVTVTPVATTMPTKVAAVLGRGRLFNAATMGMSARDKDPGATLLTRDMSIQVVMSWDAVAQNAAGIPGTIISRGLGGAAAEYVCYGLRIVVSDVATFKGTVRWFWQDVAGANKTQDGAEFVLLPGQYSMLTATRRWISPTSVELNYYIGDQLIGTVASPDGSIGGGTTGAMQLGYRTSGGVNQAFLAGTLDELMVVDRELTAEEVEGTWLRITKYQPYGVRLFKDMFDPDFPVSDVADSDPQLDIRMTGHALGYAAAQAENLRAYFLPQRAYGSTLEQWEQAVAVTPKPIQGIAERRARVLARLRQRRGVSIDGLKDALAELLDCDPDDLEFIAYNNLVTDDFSTAINPVLWDLTPTGCATTVSGKARFAPGAGTYLFDGAHRDWKTMARPIGQSSIPTGFGNEHVIAKLVVSTPQNNFEAGVWFGDKSIGNYILLGLRQDGVFKIVAETFVANISQGVTLLATPGANPAATWFHLWEHASGQWTAAWAFTSGIGPFAFSAPIAHPSLVHWGGLYIRSIAAVGAGPVADFDEFQLYMPNGTRAFNAYVFRDPGLGGSPDLEGARSVIRAIKHAFTHATIITSRAVLSADPTTPCDQGPMGAL